MFFLCFILFYFSYSAGYDCTRKHEIVFFCIRQYRLVNLPLCVQYFCMIKLRITLDTAGDPIVSHCLSLRPQKKFHQNKKVFIEAFSRSLCVLLIQTALAPGSPTLKPMVLETLRVLFCGTLNINRFCTGGTFRMLLHTHNLHSLAHKCLHICISIIIFAYFANLHIQKYLLRYNTFYNIKIYSTHFLLGGLDKFADLLSPLIQR